MSDDITVTVRFKTSQEVIDSLVAAWLHDEGITIHHGGGATAVELTYVKER